MKKINANQSGELYIMPKRILIAEDDPTTREMLLTFATMQGYDVILATHGVDLLTIAADEHIDLIITDLMMEHLDGASATEIMKLQGNTTPVIALTGLTPQEITLVQDKFVKIYHKPCNFSELFKYLESLIEK